MITAKNILGEGDPLVVDIAAECCAGIRGVEVDGHPFAIAWGGNRLAVVLLDDGTVRETELDWDLDDPIVGAVVRTERFVFTTSSGAICTVNPLEQEVVQHHQLGPNALDLVQVGDTLVQICSPATLWVISQTEEPRRLQLKELEDDARRFTDRDGFMDGEILAAREVNGKLLVELPHAYYLVDLDKRRVLNRNPKGDVRVARFDQMKMRFPFQPRAHLQLSKVKLCNESLVALFLDNSLVVWLPSQRRPWKLHLDSGCDASTLWHALTRTGDAFNCVQLCRQCGRIRLYTFDKDSPEVEMEQSSFAASGCYLDLGTGEIAV